MEPLAEEALNATFLRKSIANLSLSLSMRGCQFVIYFNFRCTDGRARSDGMIMPPCPLSLPSLSISLGQMSTGNAPTTLVSQTKSQLLMDVSERPTDQISPSMKPIVSWGHEVATRAQCLFRHRWWASMLLIFLPILPDQTQL